MKIPLNKDEIQEARYDEDKVLVDTSHIFEALIGEFDKGSDTVVDSLRAINRLNTVKTSDLVSDNSMVGARVTYIDGDGEPHRALVIEPHVEEIPYNECYDPNRDEMVDPSTYPSGTVQLIYGDGGEFASDDYFFDRVSDLQVATSVAPAKEEGNTYAYYAGWDYFDRLLSK